MKTITLALALLLTPGCALFNRSHQPPRAPGAERGDFAFPMMGMKDVESTRIRGDLAMAIALAMDDFFLSMPPLPKDASPAEQCLRRREVWDVEALPHQEGVVIVGLSPRTEECDPHNVALDGGGLYAIDTTQWRILSVRK
ncbi:hypothetical protein HPC49_51060 [Pyxidicoccus fallax]|uniref:Lipoprotein n=1 Tax=Pyxidicoccus fallax TaxID=394095 RepID=A0A848M0N8_9BACT|nr:hypothetical protein [Pyxidicoccus fallax]NMO23411.1 hypothetical protein [Pyxidicoccus fallax]NPC86515.1 hypothetical protein [Pyxidicoccus fallax]